ncbi:MAG: ZIP family metal transporter, partial [Phycisphaerae bacterium]|nr:ZIP family metal transporter [Phycisphaerae bacterium]
MSSFWLLISYCAAILVISVIGGLVPIFVHLTHTRMQVGLSFVSGVMLGVGLFHMLPHAVTTRLEAGGEAHGEVEASLSVLMLAVVGGFVVMFLVERFLCFHHHEVEEDDTAGSHGSPEGEHAHAGHDHAHTHSHAHGSAHRFGWV